MPNYRVYKIQESQHNDFLQWYEENGCPEKMEHIPEHAEDYCQYCGQNHKHETSIFFRLNGTPECFVCEVLPVKALN